MAEVIQMRKVNERGPAVEQSFQSGVGEGG